MAAFFEGPWGVAIAALAVSAFVVGYVWAIRRLFRGMGSLRLELRRRLPEKQAENPAEKILKLNAGLRTYYYLDQDLVLSLDAQMSSSDYVMTAMDIEEGKSRELSVGGALKGLTSGFTHGRNRTSKEQYERAVRADRKMAIIERHLINEQGISVVDVDQAIDMEPLRHLRFALQTLEAKTGFVPPKVAMKDLLNAWEEFQLERGISRMRKLSGYVAVSGDFQVESDESGDFILSRTMHVGPDFAQVRVIAKQDGLTLAGRTALRTGGPVRITSLGTVVRWNESTKSVVILAISIFS